MYIHANAIGQSKYYLHVLCDLITASDAKLRRILDTDDATKYVHIYVHRSTSSSWYSIYMYVYMLVDYKEYYYKSKPNKYRVATL